jgi:hypothetical protein
LKITLLKSTLIVFTVLFISKTAKAQLIYQPYSYQFYQKLNEEMYSPSTELHTAIKPYLTADSGSLKHAYDSLMQVSVDTNYKSWVFRKLFNEHLIDVKNKEYTFYFDYLPDLEIGRDITNKRTTWLNTRGYQAGGTIGSNFFFYTSGFENQAVFANYLNSYINGITFIPGQARDRNQGVGDKDWSYVTSLIGYTPIKAISVVMGVDKTFIGDGYRSMLLSDFAANYPLLRITANLGKKVQYMAMWAYLQDQTALRFAQPHPPFRIKWAAFHYIDWTITKRASLGFFNALITADADDNGSVHPFDANFVNPILFSRSLGPSAQIPDHTLAGFNGKYKILNKTIIYGQLIFDQSSSSYNSGSKYGYQAGFRGSNLFKLKSFNYLFEYNTAKPYTYSNQYPLVNYTNLDEPLAHPFGANFKEVVGILNYSLGKFDFQGELDYAKYGLDINNINYGGNILLPDLASAGNTTGQGLNTSFKYAEGKVSYLINAKYNLRLELGGVLRNESNAQESNKTELITFGLRSTFRNIYTDF